MDQQIVKLFHPKIHPKFHLKIQHAKLEVSSEQTLCTYYYTVQEAQLI